MLSASAKLATRKLVGSNRISAAVPIPTQAFSTSSARHEEEENVAVLHLNNLQDNPGAVKTKRRVGRGIGSSKGKTAGKGHKGQRARNRSSIPTGFEGGQTKFWKLLPKKGFNNTYHRKKNLADMEVLNLGTIQDYIDMGRLKLSDDNNTVLGVADFIQAGIFKDKASMHGVKLLAKGKERFHSPVRLVVNRASEDAIEHTENVGGQVTTTHYNRLGMKSLIRPESFMQVASEEQDPVYLLPKQARPPPKYQPYYTSWKNRGYLCPQVQMREWLDARPEQKEAFEKALESKVKEDS
ncbi:protein L15 [Seminavis robusta]|uniref:Protein L15 n=1 Tax=Seminavis robusta TaxID=568900 RepID=A0A9N8E192_9STRA|nr:protein L15 [Seminavis robusta]|eukprot:Sro549_g164570.1 protein L15 (296) ;mRNA; f:38316-39311